MKRTNSQKGQALILIAFGIVALVGFTALAVDGGRIMSDRRHAQNAADTAVLASALSKVNGETTYKTKGTDRATSNGYTTGVNNRTVEVDLCSEVSGANACVGLPAGAVKSEYIRVRITSIVRMTFGRILGRKEATNVVEAIAHVQTSTSSGGGSFFNGSAMVATKMGPFNNCLLMNSNSNLTIHNSGIFINCSGANTVVMNNGADLTMDAQGEVVGQLLNNGGSYSPTTFGANGGVSKTIDASTFADVPTTDPKPTCSGNGSVSAGAGISINGSPPSVTVGNGKTATFSAGNFNSIIVDANGTAIFNPGIYCISGNVNFNSNASASGPSGTVHLVLQNSINLGSGNNFDFNDLEIHTVNAGLTLNSGASLLADRLRFFSTGSGNFTVNSGGTVISQDAYFYFHSGNIVWNADSTLNLTSPTTGDYAGLLIHKPWSNSQQINFNAGTSIYLSGTFLAPNSVVDFNSKVTFELHSQIIASQYIINCSNGGTIDIYYQADQNYGSPPPANPTIELTK
jgi:hypothetical protein